MAKSLSSRGLWCASVVLSLALGLVVCWRGIVLQANRQHAERLSIARFEVAKAYIRIEHGRPVWYYDRFDPDEALAVSRTQRICRLTNSNGKILETSRAYDAVVSNRLGQEDRSTSERPMLTVFADHQGQQFVVATGTIKDADHHQYDLSVGAESATPDLKLAYGISALVVVMMLLVLAWAVRGQTAD